jgi:hypothetical protein
MNKMNKEAFFNEADLIKNLPSIPVPDMVIDGTVIFTIDYLHKYFLQGCIVLPDEEKV